MAIHSIEWDSNANAFECFPPTLRLIVSFNLHKVFEFPFQIPNMVRSSSELTVTSNAPNPISRGKFIFLSSTRLSPPVTPFSTCAKFKRCENRSFAPLSLRSSPFLNFAHLLNGVTRGASLVLINQLCFPSIISFYTVRRALTGCGPSRIPRV